MGSLRDNISQSEMNLKKITSGKRLNSVLTTQIDGAKPQSKEEEGLPVFNDLNYSNDLRQLLECPDL
jgi:hypothetical protein